MPTVDERIVNMQFNNQEFEKNAKESISTLDKLKQALHLDDAAEGFAKLQNAAANNSGLMMLGDSIGMVTDRFNLFESMAIKALNDIADKAYNTGKQLIKSLTVDQIGAGWTKFENKTKSVSTLVSQGFDLTAHPFRGMM